MKGLIIKDLMCMKKQLIIFAYVLVSVIVLSVMYVLSIRFGNLAIAARGMVKDEQLTAVDVKNLGTVALVTFMLLPIATVGDLLGVFEADGKAGFSRLSGALPIPRHLRLLSRYLTIYALFGVGVLVDIAVAFILSLITDLVNFGEFFGIIISAASVLAIHSALLIFFCILLGVGKEQYAQIFALLTMVGGAVLLNWSKVKAVLIQIAESDSNPKEDFVMNWGLLIFIKEKYWVLFLIAVLVSILSYGASYLVVSRKREVI